MNKLVLSGERDRNLSADCWRNIARKRRSNHPNNYLGFWDAL